MKKLIAIIAAIVLGVLIVTAQNPVPSSYRLNPEASKTFAQIVQAEDDLRRQFNQLEGQRITLLIGAGVPEDSRSCVADSDGTVICSKPKPSPTPK